MQMSEVEYLLCFTGLDSRTPPHPHPTPPSPRPLRKLGASCLSKMKLSVGFDADLSWQCSRSLAHTHMLSSLTLSLLFSLLLTHSFPLISSLPLANPRCHCASFEWRSAEETFQAAFVLNNAARPRALPLCPGLSNPPPFSPSDHRV